MDKPLVGGADANCPNLQDWRGMPANRTIAAHPGCCRDIRSFERSVAQPPPITAGGILTKSLGSYGPHSRVAQLCSGSPHTFQCQCQIFREYGDSRRATHACINNTNEAWTGKKLNHCSFLGVPVRAVGLTALGQPVSYGVAARTAKLKQSQTSVRWKV